MDQIKEEDLVSKFNHSQYFQYFQVAYQCAKEAGKIIQEAWKVPSSKVEFKAATDLVTETDKKSEAKIMEIINSKFPSHKILAEEDQSKKEKDDDLTDDPTWIIDPLDGTTNFVHRVGAVAVSIGFTIKKQAIIGIIYNPIREEFFYGIKGEGSYLNGTKLSVSDRKELKSALIATGCGSELPEEAETKFCNSMREIIRHCRSWRRQGSAALDMAYVACGSYDIYIERAVHAWDIAAGVLLVLESGGRVSNYDGSELDFSARQIVATNSHLQDLTIQVLSSKH